MLLLETIKYESGRFFNLPFHQNRVNEAIKVLFNSTNTINLEKTLISLRNEIPSHKLLKYRVVYDSEIRKVEFIPYVRKKITSLKIIEDNQVEYSYKYANRDVISQLFSQRGLADDVIIVKHGFVTDTSMANILFYDGEQWVTPDLPLLAGTQRAFLLKNKIIKTADIKLSDIHNFKKVRLVNAMLAFNDEVDVKTENIYY